MSECQRFDFFRDRMRLEHVASIIADVFEHVGRKCFERVRHARDLVWSESHCSGLLSQTILLLVVASEISERYW